MMPYVTQGVVKVTLGIKEDKIRIVPTNDYRIKHRSKTYTIFIEATTNNAKCFEEAQEYAFHAEFRDYLVKAALKNVHLEVTIDDSPSPNVTAVQIPA